MNANEVAQPLLALCRVRGLVRVDGLCGPAVVCRGQGAEEVVTMARGLGKLQQEVLGALEPSRSELIYYRGNARGENYCNIENWRWDKPGWVIAWGLRVRLAENVYDMRAVFAYLAAKMGLNPYSRTYSRLQASFSRAVKSLEKRGVLLFPFLVPLAEVDEPSLSNPRVLALADGLYLKTTGRQRRFAIAPDKR